MQDQGTEYGTFYISQKIKNCLPTPLFDEIKLALGSWGTDDTPLPYAEILEAAGLSNTLQCCRAEPEFHLIWRKFAVECVL